MTHDELLEALQRWATLTPNEDGLLLPPDPNEVREVAKAAIDVMVENSRMKAILAEARQNLRHLIEGKVDA